MSRRQQQKAFEIDIIHQALPLRRLLHEPHSVRPHTQQVSAAITILRRLSSQNSVFHQEMKNITAILQQNLFCNDPEILLFFQEHFQKEVSRTTYFDLTLKMIRKYQKQQEELRHKDCLIEEQERKIKELEMSINKQRLQGHLKSSLPRVSPRAGIRIRTFQEQ